MQFLVRKTVEGSAVDYSFDSYDQFTKVFSKLYARLFLTIFKSEPTTISAAKFSSLTPKVQAFSWCSRYQLRFIAVTGI